MVHSTAAEGAYRGSQKIAYPYSRTNSLLFLTDACCVFGTETPTRDKLSLRGRKAADVACLCVELALCVADTAACLRHAELVSNSFFGRAVRTSLSAHNVVAAADDGTKHTL